MRRREQRPVIPLNGRTFGEASPDCSAHDCLRLQINASDKRFAARREMISAAASAFDRIEPAPDVFGFAREKAEKRFLDLRRDRPLA